PLAGQDAQLGDEPPRTQGRQLPNHAGLVIAHGDGPRYDDDEVVGPVALPKQHLPGRRRPLLAVAAQQRQLLAIQRWGKERIRPRIQRRHPSALMAIWTHRWSKPSGVRARTDVTPAVDRPKEASPPPQRRSRCFWRRSSSASRRRLASVRSVVDASLLSRSS